MADFTYDNGRPTTPTGSSRTYKPSRSMRALNTNQPKQETFFDDATPVDRSRANTAEYNPLRDSHDLSFAEGGNVRDSVVDNMLLSLDQFSTGNLFGSSGPQYANYGEDDFFVALLRLRPEPRRALSIRRPPLPCAPKQQQQQHRLVDQQKGKHTGHLHRETADRSLWAASADGSLERRLEERQHGQRHLEYGFWPVWHLG
jgi:hypothetical protein